MSQIYLAILTAIVHAHSEVLAAVIGTHYHRFPEMS